MDTVHNNKEGPESPVYRPASPVYDEEVEDESEKPKARPSVQELDRVASESAAAFMDAHFSCLYEKFRTHSAIVGNFTNVNDLAEKISKLTETKEAIIAEIAGLNEEKEKDIESKRAQVEESTSAASAELAELVAKRELAGAALASMTQRKQEAAAELTALAERKTTAEAELTALDERKQEAAAELTALAERKTTAEAELTALDERKTTAEAELTALDERKTTAEAGLTALDKRKKSSKAEDEKKAVGAIERVLDARDSRDVKKKRPAAVSGDEERVPKRRRKTTPHKAVAIFNGLEKDGFARRFVDAVVKSVMENGKEPDYKTALSEIKARRGAWCKKNKGAGSALVPIWNKTIVPIIRGWSSIQKRAASIVE
jgi:chromosome segregation protein